MNPAAPAADVFDPALPWRRARSVALRPEPFGALVYHFGNRKLSFLKSKTLVAVVEALADHPTADATLVACGVPEAQRPAYVKALADLARSQMIEGRTSLQGSATRTLAPGPGSEAATADTSGELPS
ncbi:mycofactocin biosynthesis chaperone MftB [Geodermatophilus maliterrae]|uniref:Mycofactocin biosynthesis chaperone MftB n=1 Tax=Geodermatophilus maliterrae TaxID=3162531 RepID=A0ABV3XJE2_9ACTN